ncbi:hypothetical protein NB573_21475 [Vibrio alginolyticus]|uniref:hypothetical protein n=1 Tax=Vibrio alginolyticus TaxID=663 RepID=UPI00215C38A8|nr:hypothetical protein [Vibrio alginolyticus]MCR9962625.1 hypothetical protein [Vibrio alginolyticus]
MDAIKLPSFRVEIIVNGEEKDTFCLGDLDTCLKYYYGTFTRPERAEIEYRIYELNVLGNITGRWISPKGVLSVYKMERV